MIFFLGVEFIQLVKLVLLYLWRVWGLNPNDVTGQVPENGLFVSCLVPRNAGSGLGRRRAGLQSLPGLPRPDRRWETAGAVPHTHTHTSQSFLFSPACSYTAVTENTRPNCQERNRFPPQRCGTHRPVIVFTLSTRSFRATCKALPVTVLTPQRWRERQERWRCPQMC